jgi:prohibitin 1
MNVKMLLFNRKWLQIIMENPQKYALVKRLARYNVLVDDISLTNLDFTDDYNKAVESKQVAEQESKRAEWVTKKATNEANAEIERARGQAEAQRMIKVSMTAEILQQRAIEKWDGHFPQVMGGGGALPFINLNLKQTN